ncbi:MAG: MFS transporter [Amaricoccus sp.]|uniref:MFS transporter n=1 Tax=Amaricoccus sp. TaxID=1872485 RepID=UPI0039E34509
MRPRLLSRPALHTTGFYVALFLATGVHLPFWPLWLADWGLSASEIALYTAVGIAVRVVAGLIIPAIADRLDARRWTLAACAAGGAALFLAHLAIDTRPVLLAATIGTGVAFAGITPISEALGLAAARAWNFPYAQARGIGSSGYLAANVVAGLLIGWTGSWVALWWIAACLLAAAVLAVGHPGGGRGRASTLPPRLGEMGRLMVNGTFLLFIGTVAFLQASHAVLYSLATIHWRDLGVSDGDIGLLWAVSVAAEILFMVLVGTAVVERLGPVRTMALSCLAGVLRWGVMMFDPVGAWLWPIQALHCLTFGAGHLGAMAFIARAVPDRYAAAAQGASATMAAGAVMAFGMVVAAWLYPALGGRTYGIGLAFSAIGLGLCVALGRRWRGGEIAV